MASAPRPSRLKRLPGHRLGRALKRAFHLYAPSELRRRRAMTSFFRQLISRGDLCFDVGANVGDFTAVFLELGARVVCVEPQAECVRRLSRRFRGRADVEIMPSAVGEHEGEADLLVCSDEPTISTLSRTWTEVGRFSTFERWEQDQRVPVTTLDHLVMQYGTPKFCKIDVEGYEAKVIGGLTRPIPMVSFEFTRELLDVAETCTTRLATLGLDTFNPVLGDSWSWAFPTWVGHKEVIASLREMPDPLLSGDLYARLRQP